MSSISRDNSIAIMTVLIAVCLFFGIPLLSQAESGEGETPKASSQETLEPTNHTVAPADSEVKPVATSPTQQVLSVAPVSLAKGVERSEAVSAKPAPGGWYGRQSKRSNEAVTFHPNTPSKAATDSIHAQTSPSGSSRNFNATRQTSILQSTASPESTSANTQLAAVDEGNTPLESVVRPEDKGLTSSTGNLPQLLLSLGLVLGLVAAFFKFVFPVLTQRFPGIFSPMLTYGNDASLLTPWLSAWQKRPKASSGQAVERPFRTIFQSAVSAEKERGGVADGFRIQARLPLGAGKSLQLIQACDRMLVIAVTPAQISLLTEWPISPEAASHQKIEAENKNVFPFMQPAGKQPPQPSEPQSESLVDSPVQTSTETEPVPLPQMDPPSPAVEKTARWETRKHRNGFAMLYEVKGNGKKRVKGMQEGFGPKLQANSQNTGKVAHILESTADVVILDDYEDEYLA
jgi:flagellar biogenesis protein FliO